MKLFENIDQISPGLKKTVLTIGNFDGVHVGHQSLFREVIARARGINGIAAALTFEPHPLRVLTDNHPPPLITLFEQKCELISSLGLDALVSLKFTPAFAAMPPETFITDILMAKLGVHTLIIGRDYTFGKNRQGNIALLKEMGRQHGFETVVADWVALAGSGEERISSTAVREAVRQGQLEQARRMLGRHYQIRGEVAAGRDRGGKLLGFPTANINLQDELCPAMGVYAVTVNIGHKTHWGVANIGYSPTFDDRVFTVEVHLLDFNEDIYGQTIRVNFIQRIRDEIKFNSIDELVTQIEQDVQTGRHILSMAKGL